MYKRTEKAKKQRAEKKMKLFIQVLDLNILGTDIEEKQKINLKKRQKIRSLVQVLPLDILETDSETELRIKKDGTNNNKGKKIDINGS